MPYADLAMRRQNGQRWRLEHPDYQRDYRRRGRKAVEARTAASQVGERLASPRAVAPASTPKGHRIADISYAQNFVQCTCGWRGPAHDGIGEETPYNLHLPSSRERYVHGTRTESLTSDAPPEASALSREEGISQGYRILHEIIVGKRPIPDDPERDPLDHPAQREARHALRRREMREITGYAHNVGFEAFRKGVQRLFGLEVNEDGTGSSHPERGDVTTLAQDELEEVADLIRVSVNGYQFERARRQPPADRDPYDRARPVVSSAR